MADRVKIELNRTGVRSLLRSQAMKDFCEGKARQAQARLGGGYEVTTHTGRNRVNASIKAASHAARRENAKNNTILKALK